MDGQVPILIAIEHDVLLYGEVAGRIQPPIVLGLQSIEEAGESEICLVEVEDLYVLTHREPCEEEQPSKSRRMFEHLINNKSCR